MRQRRASGARIYHLALCENWAEALVRLGLLNAAEAKDPERLGMAIADFADASLHLALKQHRPRRA
jgi:hypothetical protein